MKIFKKFNNNTRKFMKRLQNSDDPIKELGPGISTFHSLMTLLFLLFIILGCIHIPVLQIFGSYKFYENESIFIKYSLGNMGFSKTNCETSSMDATRTL